MEYIFDSLLFDYLLKIILSVILGGLIGVEREFTHHWAGLRTHILVSLGSTLFMFITYFQYINPQPGVIINIDATRLAAGVITGIGFLGAGVIFKEGASVKGLTTAASIWVTAAIGLLVGIGKYDIAIISTIIIMLVLYSDFLIEKKIFKSREVMFLNIVINKKRKVRSRIEKRISGRRIDFFLKDFKRDENSLLLIYRIVLPKLYSQNITKLLLSDPDVQSVRWKE